MYFKSLKNTLRILLWKIELSLKQLSIFKLNFARYILSMYHLFYRRFSVCVQYDIGSLMFNSS